MPTKHPQNGMISDIGDATFYNSETGEELFKCSATDCATEFNFNSVGKEEGVHSFPFRNECSIKIENCEFDTDALYNMLGISPRTFKLVACPVFENEISFLEDLGFKMFPIRKAKSKRVQSKWNKKYGYRAINSNVVEENIKVDFDNNVVNIIK